MVKKETQRVVLSKRLIREALITLLGKTSIQKISIRELCETAGINRSTFYVHYGSQYDVLSDIAEHYISDIAATIENTDADNRNDVIKRVALVLKYAEDNLNLSKLLINNNLDPSFAQKLVALPKIQDMLLAALSDIKDDWEKQCCISFIISGCFRLIRDWINAKERIPAKKEAHLILSLAHRVCEI